MFTLHVLFVLLAKDVWTVNFWHVRCFKCQNKLRDYISEDVRELDWFAHSINIDRHIVIPQIAFFSWKGFLFITVANISSTKAKLFHNHHLFCNEMKWLQINYVNLILYESYRVKNIVFACPSNSSKKKN